MGILIYSMLASLDGYVADPEGNFDWAAPDEEVHRFFNRMEEGVGTQLYGRRMYETMRVWESPEMSTGVPDHIAEYATLWRRADKVVYSASLDSVTTARTRLERTFEPEAIRELKASSAKDISIGGPTLASQALAAGLVDECRIVVAPVVVSAGLPVFRDVQVSLRLLEERRFGNGMVYLRYATV